MSEEATHDRVWCRGPGTFASFGPDIGRPDVVPCRLYISADALKALIAMHRKVPGSWLIVADLEKLLAGEEG